MKKIIHCPICNYSKTRLVFDNYPGYIEGNLYDIFECTNCCTSFIEPENVSEEIYQKIYSSTQTIGYDRYFEYAERVKNVKNPLLYLSKAEASYYPVYKYLKEKKQLIILEIGCGYGYLTFSINQAGFKCYGIDISKSAIEYAKKYYGSYFSIDSIESFISKNFQKFDLIVATELIEHLPNPVQFLFNCSKLLRENGKVLLTTPNKNYYPNGFIWCTDLPPVHIYWFSKIAFNMIADKLGISCSFVSFNKYYPSTQNRLIAFIRSRHEEIRKPILLFNGELNPDWKPTDFSRLHKFLRWVVHKFSPFRILSNFIFNHIHGDEVSMGILLGSKKNDY